jgi:phosphoserine aminotransferase
VKEQTTEEKTTKKKKQKQIYNIPEDFFILLLFDSS